MSESGIVTAVRRSAKSAENETPASVTRKPSGSVSKISPCLTKKICARKSTADNFKSDMNILADRRDIPARAPMHRSKSAIDATTAWFCVKKHDAQSPKDRISFVMGLSRCSTESPST
jgi:hypothetical protein